MNEDMSYTMYLEHVQQELSRLDWPPANAHVEEKKQSPRHYHCYNTNLIAQFNFGILGIVVHEWCMV